MVKFVVVDTISEETFEGSLELGPLDPAPIVAGIKNASIRREAETILLSPKDIPLRGPVVLVKILAKVKGSLNQTIITCLRHQLLETQNELRAVKDQVLVLQKQLEAHATMSKPSGYPTRTFVVLELEGHFNSNCAVITEVRLHSSHGDDIPYCVSGVYDSTEPNGIPRYFHRECWSPKNLNNGNTLYHDNSQGMSSSVALMVGNQQESCWSRLLLTFPSSELSKMYIWLGSPELRVPRCVRVYISSGNTETPPTAALSSQRSTDGLSLVQGLPLIPGLHTVQCFTINFKN